MYFGGDAYEIYELVDSDGEQIDQFPFMPEFFESAKAQSVVQAYLKFGFELVDGDWVAIVIPEAWGQAPWVEINNTLLRDGYRHYLLRKYVPGRKAATSKSVPLPEDTDPATAALVRASVPVYRNSERCEKLGCNKTRKFVRMDFVCPEHG